MHYNIIYLYLYLEVLEVGRYEAGDNYSSKSSILRYHQAGQILTGTYKVSLQERRPHSMKALLSGDIFQLRLTDLLTGWLAGHKK